MIWPQRLLTALDWAIPLGSRADDLVAATTRPFRPDRTIELLAESGEWNPVEVAFGGRMILFDLLGDIYALPIEGGEARCLLGGLAFEDQPKFSPDGNHFAFISDRSGGENLWVADADGTYPRQLSFTREFEYVSPSWTPDDRVIFVARQDEPIVRPAEHGGRPASPRGGRPDLGRRRGRRGAPHLADPGTPSASLRRGARSRLRPDGRRPDLRPTRRDRAADPPGDQPHLDGRQAGRGDIIGAILLRPDGEWAFTLCDEQVYLVRFKPRAEKLDLDLNAPDVPARRLSGVPVDEVGWADGGRTIAWTTGANVFRVPFESAHAGIAEPGAKPSGDARPDRLRVDEVAVVVERPLAVPRGTVALRGAKVVTMRGDEVFPDGDVVVTDNRIAAVGPTGIVAIPNGETYFRVATDIRDDPKARRFIPREILAASTQRMPWFRREGHVFPRYAEAAARVARAGAGSVSGATGR